MELDGRTAVVTGAASGIGLALTERFLSEGMSVVMADIEQPALEREAARIADAGGAVAPGGVRRVRPGPGRRPAGRRGRRPRCRPPAVQQRRVWPTGRSTTGPKPATWEWVVGVNVLGPAYGVSTFVPLMLEQGEGHVVNTASEAGLTSSPVLGPYHATKYAVVGLSESLAIELEGTRRGRHCLCPELVATRIFESTRNAPAALGFPPPAAVPIEQIAQFMGTVAMAPADLAADVAYAVRAGPVLGPDPPVDAGPGPRPQPAARAGTQPAIRPRGLGRMTATAVARGRDGTGPGGRRRSAIRDRNREAVLDAVLDLFSEDNLSPGPEEVAERAGLSVRSVYRYFDDHDALSRAAIERQLERRGPLLLFPAIGEGPLDDRIDRFVDGPAPPARPRPGRPCGPRRIRATFDPVVRDQFDADRTRLREQIERQFAPELHRPWRRTGPGPGSPRSTPCRPSSPLDRYLVHLGLRAGARRAPCWCDALHCPADRLTTHRPTTHDHPTAHHHATGPQKGTDTMADRLEYPFGSIDVETAGRWMQLSARRRRRGVDAQPHEVQAGGRLRRRGRSGDLGQGGRRRLRADRRAGRPGCDRAALRRRHPPGGRRRRLGAHRHRPLPEPGLVLRHAGHGTTSRSSTCTRRRAWRPPS